MHSFGELQQAQIEWRAWRTVCHELERTGVNLNEDDRLTAALRLWGEELVDLRGWQTEELKHRVIDEARERFAQLRMELATT